MFICYKTKKNRTEQSPEAKLTGGVAKSNINKQNNNFIYYRVIKEHNRIEL
jgi:hypothetical protein